MDATIWDAELMFPGAVESLLEQVRSQIDRLNNDVQASESTTAGQFRNNWHSFVEEFFTFYQRMSSSWLERSYTANIDTLKGYASLQLPAWQRAFIDLGGSVSGSGVMPRPNPTNDLELSSLAWGVVKPVLLVGGALALVAYLLTRSGVGINAGAFRLK